VRVFLLVLIVAESKKQHQIKDFCLP